MNNESTQSTLPIDARLELNRRGRSLNPALLLSVLALLISFGLVIGVLISNQKGEETAEPTPEPTAIIPDLAYTTTSNTILRTNPNPEAPIIHILERDAQVNVIGVYEDRAWYEIQHQAPDNPNQLVVGWVAASQLNLPPEFSPNLPSIQATPLPTPTLPPTTPQPAFEVLLYPDDPSAAAFVGSETPLKIMIQAPNNANQNIVLSVAEGLGQLTNLPTGENLTDRLNITLDSFGTSQIVFFAQTAPSQVTLIATDSEQIEAGRLTFTTRQEQLSLGGSIEPITLNTLETAHFLDFQLISNSTASVERNYALELSLPPESQGKLRFVQRNPNYIDPPNPENPQLPYLDFPEGEAKILITESITPNLPLNNWGIVLSDSETQPFAGNFLLSIRLGTGLVQDIPINWQIPCIIANANTVSLIVKSLINQGSDLARLNPNTPIRGIGKLADETAYWVDISTIKEEGVTATEGWLVLNEFLIPSPACGVVPVLEPPSE